MNSAGLCKPPFRPVAAGRSAPPLLRGLTGCPAGCCCRSRGRRQRRLGQGPGRHRQVVHAGAARRRQPGLRHPGLAHPRVCQPDLRGHQGVRPARQEAVSARAMHGINWPRWRHKNGSSNHLDFHVLTLPLPDSSAGVAGGVGRSSRRAHASGNRQGGAGNSLGPSRFAGSSLRRPKFCGARRAAQGRSMGCRPRPAQRSAARRAFGRRGLFTSRYSAEIIIGGRGRGEFPINGGDAAAGQFPRGASDSGVHEARKVPPGS